MGSVIKYIKTDFFVCIWWLGCVGSRVDSQSQMEERKMCDPHT